MATRRADWCGRSTAKAMSAAIPRDGPGSTMREATASRAAPRWTRDSPTRRSRTIAGSSFDGDGALHAERLMRQAIELVHPGLRILERDDIRVVRVRNEWARQLGL